MCLKGAFDDLETALPGVQYQTLPVKATGSKPAPLGSSSVLQRDKKQMNVALMCVSKDPGCPGQLHFRRADIWHHLELSGRLPD